MTVSAGKLFLVLSVLFSFTAYAATPATVITPLPRVQGPVSGPGAMFPGLREVPAGTDLADYGYTVEEYLVSGTASGQPYTTRILVRKPVDPARFSGIVVAEAMHSSGNSWMFFYTRLYMMRHGHVQVEIAAQKGPVESLIVASNPQRYRSVNMPDEAQTNAIIAQVGALLKSNVGDGPLPGMQVRKLLLMGTSQSAGTLRAFLPDHARFRLSDGSPIYDGYLPTSTAGTTQIPHIDVPLIQIATQTEVVADSGTGNKYRREDGDAPGDQYRLFELAGSPHNDSRENPTYDGDFCDKPVPDFPVGAMMSMALAHLVDWVDHGILPPRAERVQVDNDDKNDGSPLALDKYGNAQGGVRNTYIDVPVASYGAPNTSPPVPGTRNDFYCRIAGYQLPLPAASLHELYGTQRIYRQKVNARLRELIDTGWFLAEYADQVTGNAMTVTIP